MENECLLEETVEASNFKYLEKCYRLLENSSDINKATLSLINSIIYQSRKVFCISENKTKKLIKNDKNWDNQIECTSSCFYNKIVKNLTKNNITKIVLEKNGFIVMEVIDLFLLKLIEETYIKNLQIRQYRQIKHSLRPNYNRAAKKRYEAYQKARELPKEELNQIEQFYIKCKELSEITGIKHHVDHIIPISKGGLHHPDNLQILTAKQNLSKGAKLNYGISGIKIKKKKRS